MISTKRKLSATIAIVFAVALGSQLGISASAADGLKAVDSFSSINDETERSQALFEEMGKVLTHPRCVNCHPVGNAPLQNMDMAKHQPPVVRGSDNFGAPAMRCTTCHGTENVELTVGENKSVPGHPEWHLAPLSMAWEDKSLRQICEQIKDTERNGGKSLAELHEHNAKDTLVGWGWNPGQGREPAPGSQDLFGALTLAWIESGAACPNS